MRSSPNFKVCRKCKSLKMNPDKRVQNLERQLVAHKELKLMAAEVKIRASMTAQEQKLQELAILDVQIQKKADEIMTLQQSKDNLLSLADTGIIRQRQEVMMQEGVW